MSEKHLVIGFYLDLNVDDWVRDQMDSESLAVGN